MEKFNLATFDVMLTPKIIVVVYWVGLLGVLLGGLGTAFSGHVFTGIGVVIGGGIGWRMWCELMIVFFKINENIQRLADKNGADKI